MENLKERLETERMIERILWKDFMELFSTPYICIKLIIFCYSFFFSLLNRND